MSLPPAATYSSMSDPSTSPPTRKKKCKKVIIQNWFVNEGWPRICFTVFILVQTFFFFRTLIEFIVSGRFTIINTYVGYGVSVAKACAAVLFLDLALILFPVCRTIISNLRWTPLVRYVPFDKNITFHKWLGYFVVGFTWVHVTAHFLNYRYLEDITVVDTTWLAFLSGPALTGQISTLALFLMATSAAEPVRRKNFEIFWYTHHLFIPFFAGLLPHGAFCFVKADTSPQCVSGGTLWKWVVAGLAAYSIERLMREYRSKRSTQISKIVLHPGKVIEVQVQKPSFRMRSGQYVFVNCPEVSLWQWHPFTLTSSPEEGFASVHIRVAGDWTEQFAKRLGITFTKEDQTMEAHMGKAGRKFLPYFMVDGPYGAASEDYLKYTTIMIVGAGIGVTPFASIIKSIWYSKTMGKPLGKLSKVYFVWTARDKQAFEWFADLLRTVEADDMDNFVEIHSYLTGRLKSNEIDNVMLNDEFGAKDAMTGLKAPTFYGRPNWDHIFSGLAESHRGEDIGVFFCGPKGLSRVLHKMSNKHTESSSDGVRFFYHKENF